jgi:hypothetical protein
LEQWGLVLIFALGGLLLVSFTATVLFWHFLARMLFPGLILLVRGVGEQLRLLRVDGCIGFCGGATVLCYRIIAGVVGGINSQHGFSYISIVWVNYFKSWFVFGMIGGVNFSTRDGC